MSGLNSQNSRSLFNNKYKHHFLNVILSLQIIVAIVWIGSNIQWIPLYGDTEEYFKLSTLLRSHSYRTVFYPWILSLLMQVSTTFLIEILYSIQWLLGLISFYYFFYISFRLILGSSPAKQAMQTSIYTSALFPALVMASNPLITHINLSVLTDGMALSFSLIFITSLISCIYLNNSRMISFSIMTVSFIMLSLMRVEKLYFGILIIFLVLLYENYEGRGQRIKLSTKYSISILITVVSVMLIYFFITSQTKIDYGEPGLAVYAMKQVLAAFSSPEALLRKIIVFGKYLLSPLVFIGEWLPAAFLNLDAESLIIIAGGNRGWNHAGWSTLWTYYHMLAKTPLLTKIYITIFVFGFGSQCLFLLFVNHRIRMMEQKRVIVYLLIFSLANALLFSFFSSYPDMHIRYALPSYISFLLIMFILTVNHKSPNTER